jgi:hypothetical protein
MIGSTMAVRLSSLCWSLGCCWPAGWKVLLNQPTDAVDGDDMYRLVFQTPDQVGGQLAWELFYNEATFAGAGLVVARVVRAVPSIEWVKVVALQRVCA